MNKFMMSIGFAMLAIPFVIIGALYLVNSAIQSGMDWGTFALGLMGLSYVGVALFIIIKGAIEKEE